MNESLPSDEWPFLAVQLAESGDVQELNDLIKEDFRKLHVTTHRQETLVHYAAGASRLAVLDYLKENGVVLDAVDKLGNTPSHWAIERNQPEALAWMISNGADLGLANTDNQTPLHYAVELMRPEMVQMIVDAARWTVLLPGNLGKSALHIAAAKNSLQIARILLETGASLKRPDGSGCPPIHSAMRRGSAPVVSLMLEFADARSLLHMPDHEGNLPLHSATRSGDLSVVRICLQAGASVEEQAGDGQTPLHLAAASGNSEVIALMAQMQPSKVERCINQGDALGQTPMHKAAVMGKVRVLEQLLRLGGNVNAVDNERRTPLIAAGVKSCLQVVNYLLKRAAATTTLRDKENRNFLHHLVLNGAKLAQVDLSSTRNLRTLLSQTDDMGYSPLHYASRSGQIVSFEWLLGLGAKSEAKDSDRRNLLQLAARHGRVKTCLRLLSGPSGPLMLNQVDWRGRSALHLASMYGHSNVVVALLRKGALPKGDTRGNTPLHLAAEHGRFEVVAVLLANAGGENLLDRTNDDAETALHLASENGHAAVVDHLLTAGAAFSENATGSTFLDLAITKFRRDTAAVIVKHPRGHEALKLPSSVFGSPFVGLLQNLPRVAILLLDTCMSYSDHPLQSPDFHVTYDFQYVNDNSVEILLPFKTMVKYRRNECLTHPVSAMSLKRKWTDFGSLFYNIAVASYLPFLALLTSVVMDIDKSIVVIQNNATSYTENLTLATTANETSLVTKYTSPSFTLFIKEIQVSLFARMVVTVVIAFANLSAQLYAIRHEKPLAYFQRFLHYHEWALYSSTIIALMPFFFRDVSTIRLQVAASAIALLLAWSLLLLYIQAYEMLGVYVTMFIEVFKTLAHALIVFSPLPVGFGLSFSIILKTTSGPMTDFKNVAVSMMSTLAMMTGPSNYGAYITPTIDGTLELLFRDMAYIYFTVFVIFISRMLMNMLHGLAVGNVEAIRRSARVTMLKMKVDYFTALEPRLAESLKKRSQITEYKHYPNRAKYRIVRYFKKQLEASYKPQSPEEHQVEAAGLSHAERLMEALVGQTRRVAQMCDRVDHQEQLIKAIMSRTNVDDSPFGDDSDDEASEPHASVSEPQSRQSRR